MIVCRLRGRIPACRQVAVFFLCSDTRSQKIRIKKMQVNTERKEELHEVQKRGLHARDGWPAEGGVSRTPSLHMVLNFLKRLTLRRRVSRVLGDDTHPCHVPYLLKINVG